MDTNDCDFTKKNYTILRTDIQYFTNDILYSKNDTFVLLVKFKNG